MSMCMYCESTSNLFCLVVKAVTASGTYDKEAAKHDGERYVVCEKCLNEKYVKTEEYKNGPSKI